ncbi:MAG: molybdopterin molybdotransferase MoeA [Planctomycetes bacterium]|nr:molybdopterin molybdotransferase MoeA [Planctomycetota bacterium]MBL7037325.1 molybdopterin molybdotransferase MoeA [Pirellulaceae bacterium]
MIDVSDALSLILERADARPPAMKPVGQTPGLVLAEDVASDIDSPPYDKALMDGYAVIAADMRGGTAELQVLEEVVAGDTPREVVVSGTATRIMTGAPMPDGADAVVIIERTELIESGDASTVRISDDAVEAGQNILPQATSLRKGDVVLRAGRRLAAVDVGIMSEVGRHEALVYPQPTVAVLATGNELVPSEQMPGPGQIRNSNGPMLCALADKAGGTAVDLGIGRDDEAELSRLVQQGLEEDVLVLSGGVSAGVLDLVPKVLQDAGVEPVFHKVRLKPGKPMWFGVAPGTAPNTLVFGLPGNPVSSLVCFELFVRPALAALAGHQPGKQPTVEARLARPHRQRGDRPTYFPAVLREDSGETLVEPLDWHGSADLPTLARANGLAMFPAGRLGFEQGEPISVLLLD